MGAKTRNSSKWLKGPLTVTPSEDYGRHYVEEIADAEDGKLSTDKAICRLFSAAPDLLRLLKEMVDASDDESRFNIANDARKVIRRATGGAA